MRIRAALGVVVTLMITTSGAEALDNPRSHPMWDRCYKEAPRFVGDNEQKRLEYAVLCVMYADAEKKVAQQDAEAYGRLSPAERTRRAKTSKKWPECFRDAKKHAPPSLRTTDGYDAVATSCVQRTDPLVFSR